jgi:hypothetical protein
MNTRVAITHELKGQDLSKLPNIRVVRNALVQLGIKNKIAALFSPHKPVYDPKVDIVTAGNILINKPVETHSIDKKIINVVTGINHDDELLNLLKNNDIVIVHWRSLPNTSIIKSLQQD